MHDYLRRLLAAYQTGRIDATAMMHATVSHEDQCAVWEGGECQCRPTITIMTTTGPVYVDGEGYVVAIPQSESSALH